MMAVLVWLMKFIDYRFFVRDITMEMYVGLIGILCTALGIWMGLRLTRPKMVVTEAPARAFLPNEKKLSEIGLSEREFEVLQLMAEGLSNQEIADRLFISLNTVKTHASNLFMKLEVKRRTQAVQTGKNLGILA